MSGKAGVKIFRGLAPEVPVWGHKKRHYTEFKMQQWIRRNKAIPTRTETIIAQDGMTMYCTLIYEIPQLC